MRNAKKVTIIIVLMTAVAAYAAGRTTTEVADLDVPGGGLKFSVEQDQRGKRAVLFVYDRHVINAVHMTLGAAELDEIEAAIRATRAELGQP